MCHFIELGIVLAELNAEIVLVRDEAGEAVDGRGCPDALLADADEDVKHAVVVLKLWRVYVGVKLHQESQLVFAYRALQIWRILWADPYLCAGNNVE